MKTPGLFRPGARKVPDLHPPSQVQTSECLYSESARNFKDLCNPLFRITFLTLSRFEGELYRSRVPFGLLRLALTRLR